MRNKIATFFSSLPWWRPPIDNNCTALNDAHEVIRRATTRLAILSEASRFLSETFDVNIAVKHVVENLVPNFEDLVSIEVFSEDKSTREIDETMAVTSLGNKLRNLRTYLDKQEILQSGKSKLRPNLIIAPIFIRGISRGTVTLGSTPEKMPYSEADLSMLEDLSRRIAAAVDNAKLYEQTREAIRTRDEFLSIASHELKTPLTSLKLQTQGLLRVLNSPPSTVLDPNKFKKMLESSDRQISRLARLIDDLLDIASLSTKKLEMTLSGFDLVNLIHQVISRFDEKILASGSTIELSMPSTLPVVWDPLRIEQVLVNLLTNAIKYGEGKKIELKCHRLNGNVEISFRDHGMGIYPVDQARVFDRFERAVSTSHFGGLGLGLYLVSQILESHDGKITLESEPGKGSIFTVILPVDTSHSQVKMLG